MRIERALVASAIASVAALICWGWAAHAAGYFFLFDDYALLGQATRTSLDQIVSTPLFGFYRPAVFLATRFESTAFGWGHPGGYAGMNVAVHATNAALVAALAWRLLDSRLVAAICGVFFLSSPWSAEAVFWMSGRFDLYATAGVLATLAVVAWTVTGAAQSRWRLGVALPVAAAFASIALFSKESSVVLVALVPLMVLAARGSVSWARTIALFATVLAIVGVYLTLRARVLSLSGGAYGDWWTLARNAPIGGNLRSFARAFVLPPVAHDEQWLPTGAAPFSGPVSLAAAIGFAAAGLLRPRQVLPLLASLALTIAPVIWTGLSPYASGTGRVLYLPGVFVVLWAGAGVSVLTAWSDRVVRAAVLAACLVLTTHYLISLRGQRLQWQQAIALARTGIEQFKPYVGRGGHIHITNLPFWFEEGPYVLKSYAFEYFYYPQLVPTVSATALTLGIVNGRPRPLTRVVEPGAPAPPNDLGTLVTFNLGLD